LENSKLEQTLSDMIQSEDNELFFYDTQTVSENDNLIFRVFIKSPNRSVTIDDCVKINHLISPYLDVYPPTQNKYFLEVSSPGIERVIKEIRHFKLSLNEKMKIKLSNKTEINCILKEVDEVKKTLKVENRENNEEITLELENIIKAKTYFEFEV
jgi:ribosome maturation factor RimP